MKTNVKPENPDIAGWEQAARAALRSTR